jgi:hypothetical protein
MNDYTHYLANPAYVTAKPVNGYRMFDGKARVFLRYIEVRKFGGDERPCERVRVQDSKGKWHNPLAYLVEIVPDAPVPKTKAQQLREKYPFFEWDAYYEALHREAEISKRKLGADRNERRLAVDYQPVNDKRTEDERMSDKALVTQGSALQKVAWESVDEVKRHVVAAYGHGSKPLTNTQIAAVVAIAWSMQLDPAPGTGHIQVWEQGGRLRIEPGYQGYIFKAQQQRQMFYNPPREMTAEERERHGLKQGEIGAVCELYEMGRGRFQKELGLPVTPIIGIAVWKPGNNVANARSPFWMACKNAIKDAIRQLGLGFSATMPQVDGFAYDHTTESWEEVNPTGAIESTSSATPATAANDSTIEGEIMNALAQNRESAPANHEGEEVVTPESPDPVTTPEPAPAAAEVVDEKPAARDLRAIYAAGKLGTDEVKEVPKPARIVAMLQNVVKPTMAQSAISEAVEKFLEKGTLSMVTTEEWRGLLAVINAAPSADEIRALSAETVSA